MSVVWRCELSSEWDGGHELRLYMLLHALASFSWLHCGTLMSVTRLRSYFIDVKRIVILFCVRLHSYKSPANLTGGVMWYDDDDDDKLKTHIKS